MGMFYMQHKKYPGNSTKLKEGWGKKSLIIMDPTVTTNMRLTRERPLGNLQSHIVFSALDSALDSREL